MYILQDTSKLVFKYSGDADEGSVATIRIVMIRIILFDRVTITLQKYGS